MRGPRIGSSVLHDRYKLANSSTNRFGDLELFEPKAICPSIAVRDREER
jgi:hypothetical protein